MINTKSLKLMSTVFVVSALLVGCGDKAEQSGADTGTGTETQTQTESGNTGKRSHFTIRNRKRNIKGK